MIDSDFAFFIDCLLAAAEYLFSPSHSCKITNDTTIINENILIEDDIFPTISVLCCDILLESSRLTPLLYVDQSDLMSDVMLWN